MALLQWLERQRDKFSAGPFRTLVNPGNFCTIYPDGKRTCFMDYRSACNMRDCFGGSVKHRNQIKESA